MLHGKRQGQDDRFVKTFVQVYAAQKMEWMT
jgi:hypothetical protein